MSRVTIFEKSPLLFPGISIGLAALFYLPYQFLSFSVLFSALSIVLIINVFYQRVFLLWISYFLFGMLWLSSDYESMNELDAFKHLDSKLIHLQGTVKDVPYFDANKSFQKNHNVSFIVAIDAQSIFQKSFKVKVNLFDYPKRPIVPGDSIEIKGAFKLVREVTIPNGFDSKKYYKENHRIGLVTVQDFGNIKFREEHFSLNRKIYQLRKFIYDKLNSNLSEGASAFYSSLLIGFKGDIDADLKSNFQQWGISHIFAISGLHMGLIAFWAWWLSGFVFISLRARTISTLLSALFYCVISGAGFSAIRAFIMLACFLCGYIFKRRINIWNSFALAFLLIFLFDPFSVYNPGFQLSFVAVAAILTTHRTFRGLFEIEGVDVLSDTFFKRKKRQILNMLLYSFMISLATSSLVAYHFNTVSIAGVFLNIVIVPLFSFVLGGSFLLLLFLPILPSALYCLPDFGYRLFEAIPSILTLKSRVHFYCESPNVFLVIATLLIFFCLPFLLKDTKKKVLFYGFLYITITGYLFYFGSSPVNRVVILDTGKASAAVIQDREGDFVVVDCGTVSGYDVLSPYLKSVGCNTINAVLVSHDNFDHFSNLPNVLQFFQVKSLYFNESKNEPSTLFSEIKNNSKNKPFLPFVKGSQFVSSSVELECLHPDSQLYLNKNEESQIIFFDHLKYQVLFTGDAQKEGLRSLLQHMAPLAIEGVPRILIMPHHGRNVFELESLLKWFKPDVVLTSGDKYSNDVVSILNKSGVKHFITDEAGTLEIRESGLFAFRSGLWRNLMLWEK